MSYEELLNQEEWHLKRQQILRRDKNRCQNCSNKEILRLSQKAKFENIAFVAQSDFYISESTKIYYRMTIEHPTNKTPRLTEKLTIYGLPSSNIQSCAFYIADEIDSEGVERCLVNIIHDELSNDFIYVRGLHVHHTYYQDKKQPWDYPNESLKILCWICHERLHSVEKVPWRDEHGRSKGELTPCFRCGGSGYLPQYYYHQNGICFRCRGAKFEEFLVGPI